MTSFTTLLALQKHPPQIPMGQQPKRHAKGPVPSLCHLYLAGLEYRPTPWAIGYCKICRLPPSRQPPTTPSHVHQQTGSTTTNPPLPHETQQGCPWFHRDRGSIRDFQRCLTSLPAQLSPLTSHQPQTAKDCLFERATQFSCHENERPDEHSLNPVDFVTLRMAALSSICCPRTRWRPRSNPSND
jgi:hypothetical protein